MPSPSPGRAVRWLGYRAVPRRPLASVLGILALAWVSVAVSLYYSSAAASPATRPSHAWTSVDEVDSLLPLRPDIAVRQVWVCGPWMQALDARTLLAALAVQDRLVTYEKTVDDGVAVTVAAHSILDSWGCSAERISADSDILDTLRRASGRRSQAGVTLLPESTLGGFVTSPSLGDGPAVAADAVGITLLSDDGSEAGRVWDHGAAALVRDQAGWHASWMEETQGAMVRIQYYPAGLADNIAFLALYGAAALHAWAHLAGLTVLKSRLWLLTFILAEVISVTLLARVISSSVGINVSTVPPAVYPLFVLGQCLANALRLIDQVSRTGQREVSQRVSLALIRLGAAPFLATAQAVVVLLLAARFAPSAGLSSLCWFATISLTLDLLAFFTFFVAALAVDLKSPGIQDSVDEDRQSGSFREKIRPISYQYRRQEHQSEVPRRLGSGAPRLAPDFLVTLGLICFVALHFIDGGVLPPSHIVEHVSKVPRRSFPSHIPAEANNPVVWLQAQSPQTLHEFLQAVKPQSSSFVAKVHTPLLVVTDAAARNASLAAAGGSISGSQSGVPPLVLGALVLALVLLGCVHFGDASGKGREAVNGNERDGDVSLTQCLARHHELDVFILVSCSRRFLVSVGFDRQVRLWDLEAPTPDSTLILPADDVPDPVGWPIALVAIDNHAEWLALCARDGRVALWSRRTRRFGRTVTVEPGDRVVACFFVAAPHSPRGGRRMSEVTTTTTTTATTTTRLLLVLRTGRLLDLDVDGAGAITAHKICDDTIRSSHVSSMSTGGPSQASALKLVTITQGEPVFVSVNREGWWTTRPLRIAAVSPRQLLSSSPVPGQRRPMRFSVVESLRGVALLYDESLGALHLVDMLSDALIYTFHRRVALRRASLRALHPPSRQCASCGSMAMASFSVAYTEKDEKHGGGGGTFAMTTVAVATPTRPVMCLRAERDARERRCVGFSGGVETTHRMDDPGSWEVTGANGVCGVRRRRSGPVPPSSPASSLSSPAAAASGRACARDAEPQQEPAPNTKQRRSVLEPDRWEAWTMTARGVTSTHELSADNLGLPADASGPACRLARNAVAVCVADVIVLVQLGKQLRDDDNGGEGALSRPTHGRLSRRSSRIGRAPAIG